MMAVQVYGCNHIVIEVTDAESGPVLLRMCLAFEDVARRRRRRLVQIGRASVYGHF